jgi:O-antigen ligase
VFGYILATGFSSWLRLGLLLILSYLLIRAARHEADGALQLAPRSFVPLAVYLGPIVVSWTYANASPSLSLFDQLPSSLVLFLAVVTLAHRPGFTHRLAGVLTAWITLLAFDAVTQFYIGHGLLSGQLLPDDRVSGPFTVATDLVLLPIALPFVFWHLDRSNRLSYAAWLAVPLIMIAILLSGSRNAWSGLLVVLLLVGYLSNQRKRVTKMFCLLLALLAVGYLGNIGTIQQRIPTLAHLSSDNRIVYWTVAWRMFVDAPILGQGPGTFSPLYKEYRHDVSIPLDVREDLRLPPHPHNLILEILAEQGLLGTLAFTWLVLAAIHKLARRARQPDQQQEVKTIAVSAIVFFSCGLIDLSLWREWVSLYFWCIYGLASVSLPTGTG